MSHYTELVVEDLLEGSGAVVKKGGALITAHYRGFLEDGREFDSSHKHGTPFQTVLSRKKVIAGWVEGLKRDESRWNTPPKGASSTRLWRIWFQGQDSTECRSGFRNRTA